MAYRPKGHCELRSIRWPIEQSDRVALIAAHWNTPEWYVVNTVCSMGLDMLEDIIHNAFDWVPPGAPNVRRIKANAFRGRNYEFDPVVKS